MPIQSPHTILTPLHNRFKALLQCGLVGLTLCTSLNALAASPCILGDGYRIPSGGSTTVYPVSCGSDCNDFPDGGFATPLFCVNGVLGESDPKLTGGPVAPVVNALLYNGYSRCTALPNGRYQQSADRKTCVYK